MAKEKKESAYQIEKKQNNNKSSENMYKNDKENCLDQTTTSNDSCQISEDNYSEETFESFEIDYNIEKLVEDDIEQICMINKHTGIFEDILNASQLITENCVAAKSDAYVLCYLGMLKIYELKKYMSKRIKKLLKEYNDHDLLLYNKISNIPIEVVIDIFSKVVIDHEVVFISRCKRLVKDELNIMAEEFKEYSIIDIEYFPVNNEEIFFVNNNMSSTSFCCNDVFYKLFLLDKTHIERFIELLRKEQKDK